MTQRLTVINIKGDTEELLREKAEKVDPVMRGKAGEHGIVFSLTARTDDGMMIVNLWPDEESSEKAFQDPEVQAALSSTGASMTSPPDRSHYEVVDFQQP
jgi:quinol monooxygenase YgiN